MIHDCAAPAPADAFAAAADDDHDYVDNDCAGLLLTMVAIPVRTAHNTPLNCAP